MALTVTKLYGPSGAGGRFESVFNCAGDTSYPTGGWPLAKATMGVSANDPTAVVSVINHPLGYLAVYDNANQKLLLYRQTAATSALVEVPNATNVQAATANMVVEANYNLGT